jgi:hypothetical protein
MKRMRMTTSLVAVAMLFGGMVGVVDAAMPLPRAATSVAPARVLDTRSGAGGTVGPVAAGQVVRVSVASAVAAGASSVTLNLTATDAVVPGYVTAWACGEAKPATSNLNFVPGRAIPNMVIVRVSGSAPTNGMVCLESSSPVQLVADLMGWFTGSSDLVPTSPNRIVDTRQSGDPVQAGVVRRVRVGGTTGVPSGAAAAALNITVTLPRTDGYLTAYPCASSSSAGASPNSSTLNYRAGDTVASFTLTALTAGDLCIFSFGTTELIIDTFGWMPANGGLRVKGPERVLDTRSGNWSTGPAGSGEVVRVRVAGRGGVPNESLAALLTLTVTDATATGYVTAWSCEGERPTASVLNFWPGAVRANSALVPFSVAAGEICLSAVSADGSPVNLIADAVGWIPGTIVRPPVSAGPNGVQFSEDFTTDQRARFDWRLQTTTEPPTGDFLGEHDMSMPCGSPTTYRTVRQPVLEWGNTHTNVDVTDSDLIWWCAPGNDTAKGHMMTALDTGSIATLSFSPKQTFNNVTRVCWDQNMSNLGEGKWVNVFVVPAADVAAHGGDLAYVDGVGIPFGGIPMRLPPGAFDFDWIRGSINGHTIGADGSYNKVLEQWKSYSPGGIATESASRYTICLNSGAGVVTLERPDGTFDTYPLGASFPTGEVRVIWQDASYNPTKHNGADTALTWHWDNFQIS